MRYKTTIVAFLLCAAVATAQNRPATAVHAGVKPAVEPRRAQLGPAVYTLTVKRKKWLENSKGRQQQFDDCTGVCFSI